MDALSHQIWDMKYRLKRPDGTPIDVSVEDSWRRVAHAAAEAEAPETRRPIALSSVRPHRFLGDFA